MIHCLPLGVLRRSSPWLLLVALFGWAPSLATATILIDDFTEVSDPDLYPAVGHSIPMGTISDLPLSTTFGDGRRLLFLPLTSSSPPPPPGPNDASMTVNIDTSAGLLTSVASLYADTGLHLGWGSGDFGPVDVDLTGQSRFILDYSASTELEITVTLSNRVDGLTITGSTSEFLTVPAGSNLRLSIPLSDFNHHHASLGPADFTSIDGIGIVFETSTGGSSLAIDRVLFVPEPSTGFGCTMGMLTLFSGRRRYGKRPRSIS